jgi:acetyl esterase/lipase
MFIPLYLKQLVPLVVLTGIIPLGYHFDSLDDSRNKAEFEVQKDVAYLPDGRAERADLYLPANRAPKDRSPAVLLIHGGGWTTGDKAEEREVNIATNLVKAGYVVMSINYVLSDKCQVTWPQNVYDCKTAVRWLRKNAERLQIDADHIGVIGGSAGGHLAAFLAVTKPEHKFDPEGPYGEYSCRVQCAVDLYGPVEFMSYKPNLPMFGKTREAAPELYKVASPINYATKDLPPILILHGTADKSVSLEQSKAFAAALEKAGAPYKFEIVEGAPHTFHLQPKQRDLRGVVIGFFDQLFYVKKFDLIVW